ncbi:MAG: hypothetical protein WBX15_20210 [Thermoanaerobaculia bacterium]
MRHYEFSERERMYIARTLAHAHDELLHELNHTSSREFKEQLRREIEMNENIAARFTEPVLTAV